MPDSNAQVAPAQLRAWAGEAIFKRGQDYQLRGRVRDLATTQSGALLAWVQGSARYATRVTLDKDQLSADCSCPYGGVCKHAIAVALAYLDRPEKASPLPVAAANDPRLALLDQLAAALAAPVLPMPAKPPADLDLQAFLNSLSQPDLVVLLLDLSRRFPDVRDALAVRQMLATDDADALENEVLGRIMDAGAEPDWDDPWDRGGSLPDYDPVYDGLKLLLDQGHPDAVVRLGEELIETGISQIEQIHDDGVTSSAIASCLELVFEALPQSSLAPHEQLRWAFDALLRDSYDLCQGAHAVFEHPYPPNAWSAVADDLLKQLEGFTPTRGDFPREYWRQRLADYVIMALEEAGRDDEIIPLCEREATANGSYQRLVERLRAAGRSAEAEQWARTGMAATQQQYPGIASQLREVICTLRAQAGDWPMVAAMRADDFFAGPTLQALKALDEAATRAQAGSEVRAAALHYLETGQMPRREERVYGGVNVPAWPLPDTGIPQAERRYPLQFPQLGLLIELAVHENRPADVLHWYDRRGTGRPVYINDDMVADAVAQAYPERATAIWRQLAEARIAQTTPAAYAESAVFLRKLRRVWARQGKAAAWREYVIKLRETNRRKRRLVEVLDALLRDVE